jgi:hypothetical protein
MILKYGAYNTKRNFDLRLKSCYHVVFRVLLEKETHSQFVPPALSLTMIWYVKHYRGLHMTKCLQPVAHYHPCPHTHHNSESAVYHFAFKSVQALQSKDSFF